MVEEGASPGPHIQHPGTADNVKAPHRLGGFSLPFFIVENAIVNVSNAAEVSAIGSRFSVKNDGAVGVFRLPVFAPIHLENGINITPRGRREHLLKPKPLDETSRLKEGVLVGPRFQQCIGVRVSFGFSLTKGVGLHARHELTQRRQRRHVL